MTYTTVLFDFDGTLADTNELIAKSFQLILDKYFPGDYTPAMIRSFNGPPLVEVFDQIDHERRDQLVAEYLTINEKLHDEMIALFPDVLPVLRRLKAQGIKLGIVSTKRTVMVKRGLDVLALAPYFDCVIGGGEYRQAKPHPEPIERALTALGSAPSEAVMVGDSWQDIASANSAGVMSVFVRWSEKPLAEILPYQPKLIINSMVELEQLVNS